jgi:hypothetical protein
MKYILIVLSILLLSINLSGQCLDIYGHSVECPTIDDSLVIYNNSLKVYSYFENNKNYKKISSIRLNNRLDVTKCFYKLDSSLDNFKLLWQQRERMLNGEKLNVLIPKNGENIEIELYYQRIDDYKFYQREFENGILNTTSPFPMYDVRIAPLVINKYINNYSDEFNGDEVEIALYIPVTVKPYSLLTEDEMKLREKILGVKPKYVNSNIFPKRKVITRTDSMIRPMHVITSTKKDSILPPSSYKYPLFENNFTNPIYANNGYTNCLIGWMIGRKFRKIKPKEYSQFAVPLYGRELLENEKELDKTLRIKFGEYYQGILN